MKALHAVFLLLLIIAAGCTSPSQTVEKPTGKGSLDLCTSYPAQEEYWQKTGLVLWDSPGGQTEGNDRSASAGFPACINATVIIWEDKVSGADTWSRVTLQTGDGRASAGWLPSAYIMKRSYGEGTEWSEGYSTIVGSWDRAGQGNGARIWYDFYNDGTFTFNYDMRGNRDNMQDRGSWTYRGNNSWELVSGVASDHGHSYISLDPGGKSFISGRVYSSYVNNTRGDIDPGSETAYGFDTAVENDIVYVKK